jgi:hypothetical protein
MLISKSDLHFKPFSYPGFEISEDADTGPVKKVASLPSIEIYQEN